MLKFERIKFLEAQLRELLATLKTPNDQVFIEYGKQGEPGGPFSFTRVRLMPTAGGVQYKVSDYYQMRGESTMLYSPDFEEVITTAMNRVLHYHRDTPFADKIAEIKGAKKDDSDEYSFFITNHVEVMDRLEKLMTRVV